MTFAFNPQRGLVIVRAEVFGPTGSAVLRLALDTGATRTLIDSAALVAIGYDPAASTDHVQVSTGSGVESSAIVEIKRIVALGHDRQSFFVLSHKLPPTLSVDGVLGLDFMRGLSLTIDFRTGQVTLT